MTFFLIFLSSLQSSAAATFNIFYQDGKVVRKYPEKSQPVIGLALSGGGARGIAHIGVIQVLEENGIRIERVAGTSMGSIVGGLYAAGYGTQTLTHMFEMFDWSDYFSNEPKRTSIYVAEKETMQWPFFDLRFDGLKAKIPSSLSSGQKIISLLSWFALGPSYECGEDFDRLPIPFRAVATDLKTGETVYLGHGNLARVLQASSTVPLLFAPIEWEGRLLVDGGLKNNLPVTIVREMGSDFVIAVAIDESMHKPEELDNPLNIADQTTSILMRNLTALSKNLADFVISPDMEQFSSNKFSNIDEIIEQGRVAAHNALPSLLKKLEEKKSSYQKVFIQTVSVHPETEKNAVSEILIKNIQPGSENNFSQIISCLEILWKTGRYISISADIDDNNGIMNLSLQKVPSTILFKITSPHYDSPLDTLYIFSSDTSNPNFTTFIADIDSLIHKIRYDGYSFAHITHAELSNSCDSLSVYAVIPELTKISLDDNIKSKKTIIMREFDMNIGDVFNLNKLMKTIDNLYGTNLFNWVYTDVKPYNGGVGLSIHLGEKDLSVMRLGFRFDETNRAEGRVALTRENIFGLGNEMAIVGHTGGRKKMILLQNKNDRIYKSFYTFDIKTYRLFQNRQLYSNHSDFIGYEDIRYGSVISVGQQMDRLGNAALQFKTETVRTRFSPASNMKNEKKEIRSIVIRSLIDSYDSYPFPKNGKVNIIYIESANLFFGGSEQYVKIFWGYSHMKTLAKKHTFLGGFSLGTADPSTPYIESFTLGGNTTRLNCYDYECARSHFYGDFQGLYSDEKYGNYLAVGKISYRLFVPKYLYLTFIYNVGNVWKNNDVITFDSLLQSYGIQASFATYLGPLSIGWGITSKGEDRLQMSAGWEF